MIDVKKFGGILNTDDSPYNVLPFQHIGAKNGRFYGDNSSGYSFSNIRGNYLIQNSLLPSGTNECIGAFFDQVKERIIFFNYNSNGNNGIYQLSVQTETISKIFISNTDSATDILRFSRDYPICSASIVYRSTGEGDLLFWTDGNKADGNRPRYLNMDTVATLAPFTEDMINVAKLPPLAPPVLNGYVSDPLTDSNRVKNKYFQFCYRWTYANFEKSTFSPFSEVTTLKTVYPQSDSATTVNNCISLDVVSGSTDDFETIEIGAREWMGVTWSDVFIVQTVSKADIATPLPFTYNFRFYNNGTYAPLAPEVTDLYFDWVPDYANTLELLNGNVLIYGGITDGYNSLTRQQVDVQIASTNMDSTDNPNVAPVMKWNQYQRYGLQYFDKRGKPIGGVVSFLADALIDSTNFDFTTTNYLGQTAGGYLRIPVATMTINHIPPQNAESYAIVRADLTPKFFLQWVTNDYQYDNDYSYFCIQSLIEANQKNGLLPSYEFSSGDRLRLMGTFTSTNNVTLITPQLDFEILGVVERTMANGNPATTGAFIKVKRPLSYFYNKNTLIEIYTPPQGIADNTVPFYECGMRYGFQTLSGVKYHLGKSQNQTASQPAIISWNTGDVYLKQRQVYPTLGATFYEVMVMDRRYNDFQESAANSNGRIWLIDTNAKEQFNGVMVRWGGKFESGTNLNNLNKFRPTDYDEADRSRGNIMRLKARDRILRGFQERSVGQWGVYARFIQNNEGQSDLVTTNEIITSNNIQYYQGMFGVGNYRTNLCSTPIADYFVDVTTGREIRLSGDGITDLGMLYKGQFYFPSWVTPYNKTLLKTNGTIAKVFKFWDSFESEAHTILQGGTGGGVTTIDRHYSFNEKRNGFCNDEYDFNPEWVISANDVLYSFKEGQVWKHEVSGNNYCNFFGVQYDCTITLVANQNVMDKKTWESLMELCNTTMDCPLIYTDTQTYSGQRQESNLVVQEFATLEGKPSATFRRDSHSVRGRINGDVLKGSYIVIKLRKQNASELLILNGISVKFIDSPLNVR